MWTRSSLKQFPRCGVCRRKARRAMSVLVATLSKFSCALPNELPVDSILSYCRYNLMIDDMDAVLTPLSRGLVSGSSTRRPCIWACLPNAELLIGIRLLQRCDLRSERRSLSARNEI